MIQSNAIACLNLAIDRPYKAQMSHLAAGLVNEDISIPVLLMLVCGGLSAHTR